MLVVDYVREDGSIPFKEWVMTLDVQAKAKVRTRLERLELGNLSEIKWFSGIGELRIHHGPGYRVYIAKDGEKLLLLFCGGTKHRQALDIEKALALHKEYKSRKVVPSTRHRKQ
jgi:putative addiction module killer protein